MTRPTATGTAALPRDGVGLALRPSHYADAAAQPQAVDFYEIIADNYLDGRAAPAHHLARMAATHPVVPHSVGMNLAGAAAIDASYLRSLGAVAAQVGAPCVTDHLCWTSQGDAHTHDLLPVPYATDLVPWIAERIRAVQRALGRPFGVENVTTYVRFARDEMPEGEFVRRVSEHADCGLVVDINNICVSSVNHGFDAAAYIAAVPWHRVLYVHVAGYTRRPDGMLHDTHDAPVADDVWALYARAWSVGGPFPTILEWDDAIPPFDVAVAEVLKARQVRA